MNSVLLELNFAMSASLKAAPGLAQAFGDCPVKVFERVPPNTRPPYVVLGDVMELPDGAEGIDASETFQTVHVWSDAVGQVEAERISAAVTAVLAGIGGLPGHKMIAVDIDRVRYLRDPDGVSTHGVITARFSTAEA